MLGGGAPPAMAFPTAFPPMAQVASMGDMSSDDPVDRLREMISDREDETIQILQNWMEDPSKKEQV